MFARFGHGGKYNTAGDVPAIRAMMYFYKFIVDADGLDVIQNHSRHNSFGRMLVFSLLIQDISQDKLPIKRQQIAATKM